MPRTSPSNRFDPRRRYEAIAGATRVAETDLERALEVILHGAKHSLPDGVLEAVELALGSFETPTVRVLFDACLLGQATPAELQEAFHVSAAECEAYSHLFFDRSVFPNDFHVISFISREPDEQARALLEEGHTRGFRSLQFKYAPKAMPFSPETTLQRIFEADAQTYMEALDTPLTSKSVKEVRALGKHVISAAQTLQKLGAREEERDDHIDFVIVSGDKNPTLEDLLAKGVAVER